MVLGTQDDPCHLSPRTTFLTVPQHLNGCRPVAAASRSLFGCRAEPTSQRESFDLRTEINNDNSASSIAMVRTFIDVLEQVAECRDNNQQ